MSSPDAILNAFGLAIAVMVVGLVLDHYFPNLFRRFKNSLST